MYLNTAIWSPPGLFFRLKSTKAFCLFIRVNLVQVVIKTSTIMFSSINNTRKWSDLMCIEVVSCKTQSVAQWESTGTLFICTQRSVYRHEKAKPGGAQASLFIPQHVAISIYKPLGPNWTKSSVFQPRQFLLQRCVLYSSREEQTSWLERCTQFLKEDLNCGLLVFQAWQSSLFFGSGGTCSIGTDVTQKYNCHFIVRCGALPRYWMIIRSSCCYCSLYDAQMERAYIYSSHIVFQVVRIVNVD